MKSPCPGSSTLITSAPRSASSVAAKGAPIRVPRSRTRMPASGPLMARVNREPARVSSSARPWQAEHSLGEDVPLDLGRPGEEGCSAIVEIGAGEAAAADGVWAGLPAEPRRPEQLHERIVHALAHLAPEELHEARLGAERLAACQPGEGPPVVQAGDRHLDPVPCEPLAEDGIGAARSRVIDALAREPEEIVEQHAMDDELSGCRAALVRQGRVRDRPALVLGPDQVLPRDDDVLQEHLVELLAARQLPEGA